MDSLKNLSKKLIDNSVWYNAKDDYSELFTDLFSNSTNHKMAIGYFSSSWVKINAKGISKFIKNDGVAVWLISPRIHENDPLIDKYTELSDEEKDAYCQRVILNNIEELKQDLESKDNFLPALAGMIHKGNIRIEVAKPRYKIEHIHIKLHEFIDDYGNIVILHGSSNATKNGQDNTYEELTMYRNFLHDSDVILEHVENEYLNPHRLRLNSLLNTGENKKYEIIPLNEAFKKELIILLKSEIESNQDPNITKSQEPIVPTKYTGDEGFDKIQMLALRKAKDFNFSLILEMATGTGKTITSIKIFLDFLTSKSSSQVVLVVACPNSILAMQWREVLNEFNIKSIAFSDNKNNTKKSIKEHLYDLTKRQSNLTSIIMQDSSLKDKEIQELLVEISDNKSLFLIVDEVHHLLSEGFISSKIKENLFDKIPNKIGLTATSEKRYEDQQNSENETIMNLFGKNSLAKIVNIHDAIYKYKVLCEYCYEKVSFELTLEETNKVFEQYKKAIKSQGNNSNEEEAIYGSQFVLGHMLNSVKSKLHKFKEHITEDLGNKLIKSKTLFYTPNDLMDGLIEHLDSKKIVVTSITEKDSQDKRIKKLEEFQEDRVQALAAIRILDEGFNIPEIDTAYFLEAYLEPRQGVQRRGRVLRRSGDKIAKIVDFVPLISKEFQSKIDGKKISYAESFIKYIEDRDKERVDTFTKDSCNNKKNMR